MVRRNYSAKDASWTREGIEKGYLTYVPSVKPVQEEVETINEY
jgi:hypothetical protein